MDIKDIFKFIGLIIGGIVTLTGLIGGIWSLYDRWCNRKPDLMLFTPYYFTCKDATTHQPCLMILARISNSSKQNAFLYLETMGIEIFSKGKWHKLLRLETDRDTPLITDFIDSEKVRFGVNDVKYLNRFGELMVSYDKPISGYIPATHKDGSLFDKIDRIRISIKDSHFRLYRLEVDLKEQRIKHDPDYHSEAL